MGSAWFGAVVAAVVLFFPPLWPGRRDDPWDRFYGAVAFTVALFGPVIGAAAMFLADALVMWRGRAIALLAALRPLRAGLAPSKSAPAVEGGIQA